MQTMSFWEHGILKMKFLEKKRNLLKSGGKFITHIPIPKVL